MLIAEALTKPNGHTSAAGGRMLQMLHHHRATGAVVQACIAVTRLGVTLKPLANPGPERI